MPRLICLLALASLTLSACSEPEPGTVESAASAPEVGGSFRLDAEPPFKLQSQAAQFMCQSAGPGSPFRATWFDADQRATVLVTGFPPSEAGEGYKIDNFGVSVAAEGRDRRARLTGATLKARVIQAAGASDYYEVTAGGEFADGGTFSASGICRA